jgi:hypothetical protein
MAVQGRLEATAVRWSSRSCPLAGSTAVKRLVARAKLPVEAGGLQWPVFVVAAVLASGRDCLSSALISHSP